MKLVALEQQGIVQRV